MTRNHPQSKQGNAPPARLRKRAGIERALRSVVAAGALAGLVACGAPGDPDASGRALARGLAKVKRNEIEAAIPDFALAVELDPGSAEMHAAYGAILERADRLDDAEAQYAQAARLNPHDPDPPLHLARVSALRTLDERLDAARRALANAPESADAHVLVGNLLLERQRSSPAQLRFHVALRLDPGHVAAHTGMGVSLVAQHREPRALHHLSEALIAEPGNARALDELIWVLATSADETIRDPEDALRRAEAAESPDSSRRLDAVAAAHAVAGRFEEAQRAARAAIAAAVAQNDHVTASRIRARLELYEQRRIFVATSPDVG